MARRKGIFGTLGSLFRWVIVGLAALFAVALYIDFSKEPVVDTGEGELVLTVPEEETPAVEAPTEEVSAEEPVEEVEASEDEAAAAETEEPVEDAAEEIPAETAETDASIIRIPGDDATYELLNAWRRDDGAIEITTQRTLGDDVSTTIRLIRCAPLESGVIAEGDAERNDTPEMEPLVLGSAAAWMAAQACGAMN